LKWVRSESACKPLIILVLSSSKQDGDVGRAYRLGANSYLVKPNDYLGLADLARVLASYWLQWSRFPKLGPP
jgi:CheY-like chemotaxis protein